MPVVYEYAKKVEVINDVLNVDIKNDVLKADIINDVLNVDIIHKKDNKVGTICANKSILPKGNNAEKLSAFVERCDDVFNVYWQSIDDAASYTVVLYKVVMKHIYKLETRTLERDYGYAVFNNLVGDGYIFQVFAEDREGKQLACSPGIYDGSKVVQL